MSDFVDIRLGINQLFKSPQMIFTRNCNYQLSALFQHTGKLFFNNRCKNIYNKICRFIGKGSWKEFSDELKGVLSGDSELFASTAVFSSDLNIGARLKLGWLPDRLCIIRYLGDNRFIAEETLNATIQPGDTFSCMQFQKGLSVCMDNFIRACDASAAAGASSHESLRYIVGQHSGLTLLEVL